MQTRLKQCVIGVGVASWALIAGCGRPADAIARSAQASDALSVPADASIPAFQTELLETAFETATCIPTEPHIKDRSRAQELVVMACLKLNEPQRAARYSDRILDWRRGAAWASLSLYCAEHGEIGAARRYVERANQVASSSEDWRRERITQITAKTLKALDDRQRSDETPNHSSDMGHPSAPLTDEEFQEAITALDKAVAVNDFDLTRHALEACAQLFDQCHEDESRRTLVEEKIKAGWGKLPVMIRIELMLELAGSALDHHHSVKALALANEAKLMVESGRWLPEDQVSLMGRVAKLQGLAGGPAEARSQADTALALFNSERDKIVNIDRAGALRAVAEAYASMSDKPAALAAYKQAVDEGVENPNSRPRAQDLSSTCCSMAINAIEPDEMLWARIHQIRNGFSDPW